MRQFSKAIKGPKEGFYSQDASKGETLLSIPLRLALTDHANDEAGNQALGRGSPSNLRLALKLLQQVQEGTKSQWYPFIQVRYTEVQKRNSCISIPSGNPISSLLAPALTRSLSLLLRLCNSLFLTETVKPRNSLLFPPLLWNSLSFILYVQQPVFAFIFGSTACHICNNF